MVGGPKRGGGGIVAESYSRPTVKSSVIFRRLWNYLSMYKWWFALALLLSTVSNLIALVGPKLSGYAIDAIEPGPGNVDFKTVFVYTSLMLVLYIISSLLSYLLALLMVYISRRIVRQMRSDLFKKLTTLPVGFFDTVQTGEVISIFSYDIDTINASLSNDILQMFTSIVTVVGSFIMMVSISPKLVLIFVVTIPASIIFTQYRSKKVRPLFRRRSAKLGELNGFIEEMTAGHKTIKAYNQEDVVLEKFEHQNEESADAYFRADCFASMTGPAVSFINNLSLALISVFGAGLYMAGSMGLGGVSSFIMYSRKFSGPINEFANILSDLQSAMAAAERVFRLLDLESEKPDAPDAHALSEITGNVDFNGVGFAYVPGNDILNNFSLKADHGNVVAIVGPTGAGKTTVINLLMRFYDADRGVISIDGHDITTVTRKSLRSAFTMVLQDTWMFYGTIYENIAYGKDGITMEEVQAAAKAAKIHNFIMSLPDGYNTILSDNAVNISKGQKQLLTIARSILLDTEILILDEATSNVDTQTEKKIQSAMLKLMKDKTCFVIAHRLSTIQNADLIIVMQAGDIAESGTHEQLLARGGFYAELYNSQFN